MEIEEAKKKAIKYFMDFDSAKKEAGIISISKKVSSRQ
jgi:hypothetical protein